MSPWCLENEDGTQTEIAKTSRLYNVDTNASVELQEIDENSQMAAALGEIALWVLGPDSMRLWNERELRWDELAERLKVALLPWHTPIDKAAVITRAAEHWEQWRGRQALTAEEAQALDAGFDELRRAAGMEVRR